MGWNIEYSDSKEEEIRYDEDEVSKEYVWSNVYRLSEKWGSMKENWCYQRDGWSSRAECVEIVKTHGENGGGPVGEKE